MCSQCKGSGMVWRDGFPGGYQKCATCEARNERILNSAIAAENEVKNLRAAIARAGFKLENGELVNA